MGATVRAMAESALKQLDVARAKSRAGAHDEAIELAGTALEELVNSVAGTEAGADGVARAHFVYGECLFRGAQAQSTVFGEQVRANAEASGTRLEDGEKEDAEAEAEDVAEEEDAEDAEDADGDAKTNKRARTEDGGDPDKKVKKLCRTLFITGFQGQPSEEEVRDLVEKHGKVATLFLPPNSGAALVFYEHSDGATAARKAFDQFEWQGSTLKSAYRNVHQAIKMAKNKYSVTLDVALTEEDPDEDEGDKRKEREKKGDVERAPNPFRQTTTEPVLYWRTVRAYP